MPENNTYPQGYSDTKLQEKLNELSQNIERAQTNEGNIRTIPHFAPLMQLRIGRITKKINKQNYMVVASNIRVIPRNCTLCVICILPSNTVKTKRLGSRNGCLDLPLPK